MSQMSYAAMIAGITISNSGTILPHIMGYPLTLFHNIPHGKACAILLPRFLKFLEKKSATIEKVNHLRRLFSAYGGVDKFINSFEISTNLSTYGISSKEIPLFVQKTIGKSDVKITPASVMDISFLLV